MADGFAMSIAHTVLVGLMFLIGLCLCCLSCCFARKKGDRERVGFIFYKVAWPLWELAALFDIIFRIIDLVFAYDPDFYYDGFDVRNVITQIANTSGFLNDLAQVFIFLTIIRLGVGVLRAQEEGTAPVVRWPRFIGWAAYGFGGVMGVLALARWAVSMSYWNDYYADGFIGLDYRLEYVARRLSFAITILFFVLSLVTLCWSIAVCILTKFKDGRRLKKCAIYIFILAILWLVVCVYKLAEFATFYDTSTSTLDPRRSGFEILVIQAIFDFGFTWVILIVLLAFGRIPEYRGGLYSTDKLNAQYWQPGAPGVAYNPAQPPMSGYDPSKMATAYAYPQQNPAYQPAPQPAHNGGNAPSAATPSAVAPSPPQGNTPPAVGVAAALPPRIPSPEVPGPSSYRGIPEPIGVELPLTHPPTEWELPADNTMMTKAEATDAAPAAPGSPQKAVPLAPASPKPAAATS